MITLIIVITIIIITIIMIIMSVTYDNMNEKNYYLH